MMSSCRFGEILDDLEKDPESHGGPPDCVVSRRDSSQFGFRVWQCALQAGGTVSASLVHGCYSNLAISLAISLTRAGSAPPVGCLAGLPSCLESV